MTRTLDGTEQTTLPGLPTSSVDAKADLNLPNIVMVGAAYQLTPQWAILGQFNWFGWSTFKEIDVEPVSGPNAVIPENYRNSFSIAVGAEYKLDSNWTLRSGFQYDRTPTVDAFRSATVPDGDRYWLALGASYVVNDWLSFDAAYAHNFVASTTVNATRVYGPLTTQTIADVSASADILSLNAKLKF